MYVDLGKAFVTCGDTEHLLSSEMRRLIRSIVQEGALLSICLCGTIAAFRSKVTAYLDASS
ncbi:MAG: hypothetical protein HFH15_02000 [Ruminococcus sp.]|jgi:hypothetical protein|nr:hypothetical protein [Ruminococcus sp.]